MRAIEFIREGGWTTTVTQGTVISPTVVKKCLAVMQQFTSDFNQYLAAKDLPPVKMGRPTGSSAYHDVDPDDKVYGDIDLQMIAPQLEPGSHANYGGFWSKLAHSFVLDTRPSYVEPTESKIAHPIIQIGKDQYVQVDLMWHTPELANWGAARVTPERGVKGLLFGNMFSVFGDMLDMSIQHAGVQMKTIDGERVPFSKQKGTEIHTISKSPETFMLDIFNWMAARQKINNPKVDAQLASNPGINTKDVKISTLVAAIKGFAASADANGMFGKGDLVTFSSGEDLINQFVAAYKAKAEKELASNKRDKAETPEAKARAEQDLMKIQQGLDMVLKQFAG